MRFIDLLLPAMLALFFYCILPAAGIVWQRFSWRWFRSAFFKMNALPTIDYAAWRMAREGSPFKFAGFFESFVNDNFSAPGLQNAAKFADAKFSANKYSGAKILCRSDNLRISVILENANLYLMLKNRAPEKLRASRLPILAKGLRIFAGGALKSVKGENVLTGGAEMPLFVIFYEGGAELVETALQAGRHSTFYWNHISICSYIVGTLALVLQALPYISRPAYQFVIISSFCFVFLPFLVLVPPGLFLVMLSRKIFDEASRFRVKKDIASYETTGLPYGASLRSANALEALSWLFLAAAAALNGILLFTAIFVFL